MGAHGVDRQRAVDSVPLRDPRAGDGLLRGDRASPQDAQAQEVSRASGCIILILDVTVKTAMILFWTYVIAVVHIEVINKLRHLWR